jgi:protein SCO1/2
MKRMDLALAAIALLAALALPACVKDNAAAAGAAPAPAAASAGKDYAGHGVIRGFQSDGKVVVLEHQAIPGLMEGMTMGFELKPVTLAQGFKVGDKVDFTLTVAGDDWAVTGLAKAK